MAFRRELKAALRHRPRSLSPKWFYDAEGSRLFERICELPEYYPTRTELAILDRHAPEMAALAGPRADIIEFGAGSLRKVRCLLAAFEAPARYVPIDISGEALAASVASLKRERPGLRVEPVVADYSLGVEVPHFEEGRSHRIGFFPGSTLGNFSRSEALQFLERAAHVLRRGALILGVDRIKEPARLHAAYNDAEGVTAAFNRHVLVRANRELGCDFVPERFFHSAFYNAPLQRIEMHLVSARRQQVRLDGEAHTFEEGETLHTECSHKYTVDGLHALAREAGFRPGPVWTDTDGLFSVHWLHAPDGDSP